MRFLRIHQVSSPYREALRFSALALVLVSALPARSQGNGTGALFAPGNASLIAVPGSIRQISGKYPASTALILAKKFCPADNSNDFVPNSTYTVTVAAPGLSTTANPQAFGCQLTTILTIDPAATSPGYYLVDIVEHRPAIAAAAGKAAVPATQVDLGNAVLTLMDAAAGPIPGYPQVDVIWGVTSRHLCADNFGKHVAKDLYCIEVKIGNNTGHAVQLAGVGFKPSANLRFNAGSNGAGATAKMVDIDLSPSPNVSYQSVRASAQSSQFLTTRSLLFSGTSALGILMGSFSPFFTNVFNKQRFASGTTVVGTALPAAIDKLFPDQTIKQLNNLDDLSFRDGKLIPNNTQIRTMVFVERSQLHGFGKLSYNNACAALYNQADEVKTCEKTDDDPSAVKIALGHLVIVGDEIDFIQRIVVDPAVTSQEVSAGSVAALAGASTTQIAAKVAGVANPFGLFAVISASPGTANLDANYSAAVPIPVDQPASPDATSPVFTITDTTKLLKSGSTYDVQFKDAAGAIIGTQKAVKIP